MVCARRSLGAEIRAEQALVGVQHDDQRDVRKVVALGDHLGADEDARLAAVDAREHRFHLALAAHRVAIEPGERRAGKLLAQRLLDALGALADWLDARCRTAGSAAAAAASAPQ